MGNCLRHDHHQSDMEWGGDYWRSPQSEKLFLTKEEDTRRRGGDGRKKEAAAAAAHPEEMLQLGLGEKTKSRKVMPSSSATVTEVKIKISKKQLEELVGKVDVQGLSVQQMLAQLMSVSDVDVVYHQRSWRPALQTIPE